ncbi:hypothetical protein IF1G_00837 [Cordyceps javanica]|uniref:Uncharacterized protein n=1 Tax=Cordyceps javanica TaxID=43265 RepID=A0A545VGR8_9HYPO|nr:hypothetical protein IF1G_00837 [Cordyceps javanica]
MPRLHEAGSYSKEVSNKAVFHVNLTKSTAKRVTDKMRATIGLFKLVTFLHKGKAAVALTQPTLFAVILKSIVAYSHLSQAEPLQVPQGGASSEFVVAPWEREAPVVAQECLAATRSRHGHSGCQQIQLGNFHHNGGSLGISYLAAHPGTTCLLVLRASACQHRFDVIWQFIGPVSTRLFGHFQSF